MYELPEVEEKGLILWRFRFILVKQCRRASCHVLMAECCRYEVIADWIKEKYE